jgi:hypothetical protein
MAQANGCPPTTLSGPLRYPVPAWIIGVAVTIAVVERRTLGLGAVVDGTARGGDRCASRGPVRLGDHRSRPPAPSHRTGGVVVRAACRGRRRDTPSCRAFQRRGASYRGRAGGSPPDRGAGSISADRRARLRRVVSRNVASERQCDQARTDPRRHRLGKSAALDGRARSGGRSARPRRGRGIRAARRNVCARIFGAPDGPTPWPRRDSVPRGAASARRRVGHANVTAAALRTKIAGVTATRTLVASMSRPDRRSARGRVRSTGAVSCAKLVACLQGVNRVDFPMSWLRPLMLQERRQSGNATLVRANVHALHPE